MVTNDERLNTVFFKLLDIYQQVKEPGKSALVIFPSGEDIASFVEEIGGPDAFKLALTELTEVQRIHARKMNYPPNIPEAYEVTFATCKFCGSIWGLSWELDFRYGVTREEAEQAGYFWCCGMCYARVLNAAYCNLPEMRPKGQ
jgi:hypothetical protein